MNHHNRGPFSPWQLALYIAALGVISVFLAPVTALWWIVPVLGVAAPLALAAIQRQDPVDAPDRSASVVTAEADPGHPGKDALPDPDQIALLETAGLSHACASPIAAQPPEAEHTLSDRELEVLAQLAAGKTNAEVAEALFISVGTVKSHSANIYRKLEAKNRTEAVARARERGLLE